MSDAKNVKQSVADYTNTHDWSEAQGKCLRCDATDVDKKCPVKVERCKYRHEWVKVAEGYKQALDGYICRVCDCAPKRDSKLWSEASAILKLREMLPPGSVVRTILRHVSRSGMNRRVSLAIAIDGDVKDISWLAAHAMGDPVKNRAGYVQDAGIEVGGCGMDVGFELVYNLGRVLWPHGFVCVGEKCQSNDHSNDPNCKRSTFVGQTHTGDGGYALRHEWL